MSVSPTVVADAAPSPLNVPAGAPRPTSRSTNTQTGRVTLYWGGIGRNDENDAGVAVACAPDDESPGHPVGIKIYGADWEQDEYHETGAQDIFLTLAEAGEVRDALTAAIERAERVA